MLFIIVAQNIDCFSNLYHIFRKSEAYMRWRTKHAPIPDYFFARYPKLFSYKISGGARPSSWGGGRQPFLSQLFPSLEGVVRNGPAPVDDRHSLFPPTPSPAPRIINLRSSSIGGGAEVVRRQTLFFVPNHPCGWGADVSTSSVSSCPAPPPNHTKTHKHPEAHITFPPK